MAAISNGTGFQVLLDGAASHEGKYYLWEHQPSGVITKGSGWKTAEHGDGKDSNGDQFSSDLNGDGVTGVTRPGMPMAMALLIAAESIVP